MIARIALQNIRYRPLNTILSLILLTSAVAIISLLILLQEQFEKKFSDNIDGVDLVMGAKGSPLQLILSSVYQMDAPTGNINLDSAKVWMNNPFVQSAIPLAFGDNYRGYKIVGTTPDYVSKFDGKLASGKMFSKDLDVVVGHNIAANLGLQPGDTFHGTHGDVEEGETHEEHSYIVTGILAPTGKVIDNVIVCTVESVWKLHSEHGDHDSAAAESDEEETHDHAESHDHDHAHNGEHSDASHGHESEDHVHEEEIKKEPREITAVLFKMRNKMALVTWPRIVAQNTSMQLASPAVEVNRLFTLFGVGIEALQYLAYGIMLIAGISIFIALFNTLKERKYEFALMRISGAGRLQMLWLVLFESLFLCIIGFVLGITTGRLALMLISNATQDEYKMAFNPGEFVWEKEGVLLVLTIFTGIFAALIPAIKAYRLNISKTLANA